MLRAEIFKQLPDFNLELCLAVDNEILVLAGPSGSGKTTLLHCLAGLFRPDRGEITLNDQILYSSARRINLPPRRRRVGYVFQNYALFPHLTVKQNAEYSLKKRGKICSDGIGVAEVLEMLQISHLAGRYPAQISGGEKQRTALARALLARPKILLLDEPLSALDRETRLKLQAELKSLQQKWSIPFIFVTHDLEEARTMGDRIVFFERGQVKEEIFLTIR